jgi:hypothetical protein
MPDTAPNEKIKCPYCGEPNSLESEFCWACYKNLRIPKETRVEVRLARDLKALAGNANPAQAAGPARHDLPELWESAGRLLLAAALFFFYLRWFRSDNYFSALDHINLAFHEAGHIFLGLFGRFLMTLGGSLFQLLIPAVCAVHLWRRESRLGAQLCVFWFGENLLNISIYAGDAIKQALPLVGGGVHDWTYLLTETHLIAHTPATAKTIFIAGSAFIFYALFLIIRDGIRLLPLKPR